jgi:hypothetical protein
VHCVHGPVHHRGPEETPSGAARSSPGRSRPGGPTRAAPGEALAYRTATHGRAVPKPVKSGIADAAARLYNERSFTDPGEVARARQFPYRFPAAYENAPSLRWGAAPDRALQVTDATFRMIPLIEGGRRAAWPL